MTAAAPRVAVLGEEVGGPEYLKGYNTFTDPANGKIMAAACGAIELVERVLSVRCIAPRYVGEVGDVVVGRIVEVSGNRWKCDIGGHAHATILLANVTDPGGILRRRGREDELSMRTLFAENDLVAAEVQRVMHDGSLSLHTRTVLKYGKLTSPGQLVVVNPSLVRRVPKHFYNFVSFGVAMILGINGRIWLGAMTPQQIEEATAEAKAAGEASSESDVDEGDGPTGADEDDATGGAAASSSSFLATDPTRVLQNIARMRNVIAILHQSWFAIYPRTIAVGTKATIAQRVEPAAICHAENRSIVTDAVLAIKGVVRARKRPRGA